MDEQSRKFLIEASYEWIDTLSKEERLAIFDYTILGYEDVNEYLRGNLNGDIILEQKIHLISSAIRKFKYDKEVVAYRGVSESEFLSILSKSSFNTFYEFKSTSLSEMVARDFSIEGYIVMIHAPKGTRGAYIELNSEIPDEYEYLLDKETHYIIKDIVQETNHQTLIKLEVIPDGK